MVRSKLLDHCIRCPCPKFGGGGGGSCIKQSMVEIQMTCGTADGCPSPKSRGGGGGG